MNAESLLQDIGAIADKHRQLNQATGGYFNVFDIMELSTKELAVCRMIYELLSPQGSHYQGELYLRLFFREVLGIAPDGEELKTAKVYREYLIGESRRIDLVIETPKRFIPIEVKIYAQEQENQCRDYLDFAKGQRRGEPARLYYLTRFGTAPSAYSTGQADAAGVQNSPDIICISFAQDITAWLEQCLRENATLKAAPIREVLLQFLSAVKGFTNQMEDEKMAEIKSLLLHSAENMQNAIALESALAQVKKELMLRFFQSITQKVSAQKPDAQRLKNIYDFEYNECSKVNGYYSTKGSTYPGISYLYKTEAEVEKAVGKQGVALWVRLEIDRGLFAGYVAPKDGKYAGAALSAEDARVFIKNVRQEVDNSWWLSGECLPADAAQCPDFKGYNDAWCKLAEPKHFDSFTAICANKIVELLNQ